MLHTLNYASLKEKCISSIMDNSVELFSVIDANGIYQFVGGSVRPLLGFQPDELVGKSALDFVHPDDKALVGASIANINFNRTTDLPNFRFIHQDGTWRWIQCRITNMSDNPEIRGFITNSIDITDKVNGERHQIRTQAHYESLFHNHPDTVFELDRGGYFTQVNKNFKTLTGYSEAEITGVHFRELVVEGELPIAMNAFVTALEGNPHQVDLTIVRADGDIINLNIAIVPVTIGHEIVKIQGIARDITIKKKYEQYIKAQADQLQNIMERMPESFFSLDSEWRYTYVNKFYCNYIGFSKEELIGQNIWELFPGAVNSSFYKICNEVAQTGMLANIEEVSPYHKTTIIGVQIYPTGEDISVHFVDITEKKSEQDRLEKLSLVASKTNTCILIKNRLGQIEWANEAYEKVTGYTLGESLLKDPIDFLTGRESDQKTLLKIRKRISSGKQFSGEVLNYSKKGAKIWFYLEITPVLGEDGEVLKYISIRTDITQRKIKEQELLMVTRELFEHNHDLQHFSYMVSHNLRAPAANVMGLTHLLNKFDPNTEVFKNTLANMKKAAHNLDTVIQDMNHVLTVRENKLDLPCEELLLHEVVSEALVFVDYKLHKQPCELTIDIPESIKLISNKTYLLEIIKNLLSNAAKFRKKNETLQVHLKAREKNGAVVLSVIDNGVGLDLELVKHDLYKIYKKFHVGYPGRGIGLFLVKTYLDNLKGHIKIYSEPDIGTTFKITLNNYI